MPEEEQQYEVLYVDEAEERYVGPMSYSKAEDRARTMDVAGITVVAILTAEAAEERRNNPDMDIVHPDPELLPEPSADHVTLFEGEVEQAEANKPVPPPEDALMVAFKRAKEKIADAELERRNRATIAERSEEPRRYQALELALRLAQLKLSPDVGELVKDAKVIEKYLKGPARRSTSS